MDYWHYLNLNYYYLRFLVLLSGAFTKLTSLPQIGHTGTPFLIFESTTVRQPGFEQIAVLLRIGRFSDPSTPPNGGNMRLLYHNIGK